VIFISSNLGFISLRFQDMAT